MNHRRVDDPRTRRRGRNTVFVIVLLAAAVNVVLGARYFRYENEASRLRQGMTAAQRERADAVVRAERHRLRVELELVRRQARGDRQLHLSVNVDSGRMVLERDGVVLRDMTVRVGPERFRGVTSDSTIVVRALGQRTVHRVLDAGDAWEVPEDVFTQRGQPVPENRKIRGALGDNAILLTDGTVIYAVPEAGPLADSTLVLPGSVQVSAEDLKAIATNIRPGMSIYFYK
jgi:hypothetical protein